MRTKIKWVELHSPLFMGTTRPGELGVNLKNKISSGSKITMEYCEERRHLYVTFEGRTVRVPEPSILSMVEELDREVAPYIAVDAFEVQPPKGKRTAQVSTPQDHVFAGKGAGKTGVEEAVRKL